MEPNEQNPSISKTVRTINFRCEDKPTLTIQGKITNLPLDVVVDTGAEITVLNEDLARKLNLSLGIEDTVFLEGAVDKAKVKAKLVKYLRIRLGKSTFKWDVYLASASLDRILFFTAIVRWTFLPSK